MTSHGEAQSWIMGPNYIQSAASAAIRRSTYEPTQLSGAAPDDLALELGVPRALCVNLLCRPTHFLSPVPAAGVIGDVVHRHCGGEDRCAAERAEELVDNRGSRPRRGCALSHCARRR